ncbi:hypothetical protein TrVE_jg6351 [Triparma verrucosa]|uniref:Uncharacterized protein n=1 Tax=Triparma verrucosa TaxID=1606542 RepID=A0A9W7B865_9STRA|nr:hypothetical protein TrVE_jg6351 [Triparma verrucosa]
MRDREVDYKNGIRTVANFLPTGMGGIYFAGLVGGPFLIEVKTLRDMVFFALPAFVAASNLKTRLLDKDWKNADEDTAKTHMLFGLATIVRVKVGEWGWF